MSNVAGLTIEVADSRIHEGKPVEVEIMEDLGSVLVVQCVWCPQTAELDMADLLPYLEG
jgi:hypothetical protein